MRNPSASVVSAEQERTLIEACSLTTEECLARLGGRDKGLTAEEAEEKLRTVGRNEVSLKKGGAFSRTIRRFANPLVIQLLIIAGVSFLMGDLRSTLVVGGMVLLSVGLSAVQEERSGKAVEKLQAMVRTTANVLREGKEAEIPLAEIVPGDVVVLDAGSLVPADIRLISHKGLLRQPERPHRGIHARGERAPPRSPATASPRWSLPTPASRGATCCPGTARGVVVNTGARTYFGAITRRLAGQQVADELRQGDLGVHVADDPLHGHHGR